MVQRTVALAAGMLAALTLSASAQDPIAERQAKMEEMGGAMRVLVPMARGQADYDAGAALAAFVRMNDAAQGYGDLFPEGSETGGDTRARPEIWSDREGFDAAVLAFEEDLAAAVAAEPASLDDFRPIFGMVTENCGACHEKYQVPNS